MRLIPLFFALLFCACSNSNQRKHKTCIDTSRVVKRTNKPDTSILANADERINRFLATFIHNGDSFIVVYNSRCYVLDCCPQGYLILKDGLGYRSYIFRLKFLYQDSTDINWSNKIGSVFQYRQLRQLKVTNELFKKSMIALDTNKFVNARESNQSHDFPLSISYGQKESYRRIKIWESSLFFYFEPRLLFSIDTTMRNAFDGTNYCICNSAKDFNCE